MWERLLQIMDKPAEGCIAVVGDFMLDAYLYGDAERISPEAPVPVLRVVRETFALGGAGSVAADVAALGDTPVCFGIVGDDDAGRHVRNLLIAAGADVSGLLTVPARPTTKKTRLVGLAQHRHRQQLIRVDAEQTDPIDAALVSALVAALEKTIRRCGAVCVEDYGKGLVTPLLMTKLHALTMAFHKGLLVDPARTADYAAYAGATLVTPNRSETELVTGLKLPDIDAVRRHAGRILDACRSHNACVTLDAEGMALIKRLPPPDWTPAQGQCELVAQVEHIPTRAREVYDVTGAGDEVLAALAVGLARGLHLTEACTLANVAGGLEVEKFGCVPVTRDELVAELLHLNHQHLGKHREIAQLLPELQRRRAGGQKVVFTNGCFDLLHPGHVELFSFCRQHGDLLVVGLNSDASVRSQNKGGNRPILNQDDRARVLAALADVDYVVIFNDPTPAKLIESIRPDVLVKGEDWAGRGVVGQDVVESYGGKVVLAKLVAGHSTSNIVDRIRKS